MKKINIKTARANQKNHSTEMVFILDRSGSMAGLEHNRRLQRNDRKAEKTARQSIRFNRTVRHIDNRTSRQSGPQHRQADDIGRLLRRRMHRTARRNRRSDKPYRKYPQVRTSGGYTRSHNIRDNNRRLENASRRYSKSDIKRMIERQRSKYGWEFLFIGANIDAIVTAESFGIGQSRAVNYHADKKGTEVIYDAISAPLTAMRSTGRIDDNWSEEIEEDFNNRK